MVLRCDRPSCGAQLLLQRSHAGLALTWVARQAALHGVYNVLGEIELHGRQRRYVLTDEA